MNTDSLYDFQKTGVDWLRSARDNTFGFSAEPYVGLLADEMGLGKTAQGLTAVKDLINSGKKGLFIVPGSTIIQWQKQFDKWVLDGNPDDFGLTSLYAISSSTENIPPDFNCVMSHNLLARKPIVTKLAQANFDFILIDEIHKFGATSSKRLTHLWALWNLTPSKFESGRIGLSGTPVRNYAKEIYNIAHFLDPIRFRNSEDFARKYLTYDRKALYNPHQFHADFAPYYLRRTVGEVQKDLPSIRRTKLYTAITNPKLAALYNKNLDILTNVMNNGDRVGTFSLLGYLVKLRHITGLAKAAEPSIIDPMLEYLNEGEVPKKIVIGIHHRLVATRLMNSPLGVCKCGHSRMSHYELDDNFDEHANTDGCSKCSCEKWNPQNQFFMMRGGQSMAERESIKQAFIKCEAPAIMLLSIKAAGEGVDGLQYASSKAYVLEPQWNMAEIRQFEKRIHRTGQTEKCHVEYTVASGTIDEFFWDLSEQKEQYTTQVDDVNWETNPAFLRKLAETVIAAGHVRIPSTEDMEEFERITQPKKDIAESVGVMDFEAI